MCTYIAGEAPVISAENQTLFKRGKFLLAKGKNKFLFGFHQWGKEQSTANTHQQGRPGLSHK
jgi:hypothetical protein